MTHRQMASLPGCLMILVYNKKGMWFWGLLVSFASWRYFDFRVLKVLLGDVFGLLRMF